MCVTADRKGTINFVGKNLFWYPVLFALYHILFERGIFFVKGRGTVYLREVD